MKSVRLNAVLEHSWFCSENISYCTVYRHNCYKDYLFDKHLPGHILLLVFVLMVQFLKIQEWIFFCSFTFEQNIAWVCKSQPISLKIVPELHFYVWLSLSTKISDSFQCAHWSLVLDFPFSFFILCMLEGISSIRI